ncbi:hypothetical protein AGMMS49546_34730 [Spirochaetia bacterium]|nr:hypothetical protein AGMMS49546_34730 [Spirochaetia bacterium]
MSLKFPLSGRAIRRLARKYAAEGRILDVMLDIVFKLLFTANDDDSREALRLLLSDCTHRSVRNVQVQNNEILPEYLTGKTVRLDIHVTFNDGEQADLEIIIYEMPKLKKVVKAYFEGKVELKNLSPEQKWCIYFRYKGNEKMESLIQELCRQEEGIMRADRALSKISRDQEKWAKALFREKAAMDYSSGLYAAGKAGEERGIATGYQRAEAKYTKLLEEKDRENARKLKAYGDSIEKIASVTGLSPEEIKKL